LFFPYNRSGLTDYTYQVRTPAVDLWAKATKFHETENKQATISKPKQMTVKEVAGLLLTFLIY